MANNHKERPIRLRPRRSKRNPNDDPRRFAGALGSFLRLVQMTRRHRGGKRRSSQSRPSRLYGQRVSVRVTYSSNKNPGQWKAHGRYIARDTATQGGDPSRAGFDATRNDLNIASVLDKWQHAGDERFFKIIVSPEFGERLNLQDQTRKLLRRMEQDLRTRLEWVAAAHFNTEHPHVHIALRGKEQNGSPLVMTRDYIRSGIRTHAENLATEALGFRTERDAEEVRQREITQNRYTSLDRIIQRSSFGQSSWFVMTIDVTGAGLSERERILQQNLSARLAYLEKMHLAKPIGPQQWAVQSDFESVLRTLQRTVDRQKMLAAHGALASDPRLPFEIMDIQNLKMIEGRVLLHAEDEAKGRAYLLLEGTDAKVHLIYHTEDIEDARRAGKLAVNSFVRLEKSFVERIPHIEVSDYGDANKLLESPEFLKKQAQSSVRLGIVGDRNSWSGWLGEYYERLQASTKTARVRPKEAKRIHSGRSRS